MMNFKINLFLLWLILLGLFVCIIILIGGYTRISDSGLSITQWQPISGILFPLNESQWIIEFSKYKLIDEYKLINSKMSLNEFKFIYFWEWFHRAVARFIGLLFLIPYVIFFIKRKIPSKALLTTTLIGAFIIIQAIVGWYMVKSGLVDRVDVSHYRLSVHLINAFIILALIIFTFVLCQDNYSNSDIVKLKFILLIFTLLIFFQIFYGAFVSGTHAGLTVNTWPTFNGEWIPSNILKMSPILFNFFENKTFIVFFHRSFAFALLFILIFINIRFIKLRLLSNYFYLLITLNFSFVFQILIGIWMTYYNIPWHAALAHQGNSIIMFAITIYLFSRSIVSVKT